MKYTAILCLTTALSIGPVCADVEADRKRIQDEGTARGRENLRQIETDLVSLHDNVSDTLLIKLATRLPLLANDYRFKELREEASRSSAAVRKALLETPGHAEAFERRLLGFRAELEARKGTWNHFHNTGIQISRALPYLQSAETMRVLGRMLEDTKGSTPEVAFYNQAKESFNQPPISSAEYAVVALQHIGIQEPPVTMDERTESLVIGEPMTLRKDWQRWWREVKDGKRTYRFTGSDVEYGYDGPVKTTSPSVDGE